MLRLMKGMLAAGQYFPFRQPPISAINGLGQAVGQASWSGRRRGRRSANSNPDYLQFIATAIGLQSGAFSWRRPGKGSTASTATKRAKIKLYENYRELLANRFEAVVIASPPLARSGRR